MDAGEHSSAKVKNALVLAVSLEAKIERSTVENARQRQRTLYPLVSSKARRFRRGEQRVSYRERSTPWFLLDSFVLENGVGSELQTQRFGMLADKRSEVFPERLSFYTEKNPMFENLRYLSVSSVVFPTRRGLCGTGFRRRC